MNVYISALLALMISFASVAHDDKDHIDKDEKAIIDIISSIK